MEELELKDTIYKSQKPILVLMDWIWTSLSLNGEMFYNDNYEKIRLQIRVSAINLINDVWVSLLEGNYDTFGIDSDYFCTQAIADVVPLDSLILISHNENMNDDSYPSKEDKLSIVDGMISDDYKLIHGVLHSEYKSKLLDHFIFNSRNYFPEEIRSKKYDFLLNQVNMSLDYLINETKNRFYSNDYDGVVINLSDNEIAKKLMNIENWIENGFFL
jgi:hypothetical protein